MPYANYAKQGKRSNRMKKLINKPEDFVKEFLDGIALAYSDRLKLVGKSGNVIARAKPKETGKVAVVTAGGSGHLPVFLGYVGEGLLDGCAVGNVFASPSSEAMFEMIQYVDSGAGVLCLYGNYSGDVLNLEMARDEADFASIKTAKVLVSDDVASHPKTDKDKRRGVAGMAYAFKVAGAAAEEGLSLEEVEAITREALNNICTMGVALSPCIIPTVGKPTFQIGDDQLELGMGIHGEPGIMISEMKSADKIVDIILEKLLDDVPLTRGDEVSIMVNGLGATPLEELLIIYRRVHKALRQRDITIYMPHIGEFATSMEMAGCSITLFKLNAQLKRLLRAPASTPFYTNENK